jgi:IS5 family transposase
MREKVHQQQQLVPVVVRHEHGDELRKMSEVLDALPEATTLVHADLVREGTRPGKGRKGLSAEQVLRILLIKQINDHSYDELAFHLADSNSYRWFCRIGIGERCPDRTTLQKAIKRVRPETCEAINRMLVRFALGKKIERGEKVRTDCTAVESNIHHPNDSSLLWDCVRVLSRLMGRAHDDFGVSYNDHTRRAQRRAQGISFAKSTQARLPLYRDLLAVADKTVSQARRVAERLDQVQVADMMQMVKAQAIATELRHFTGLSERVISQTERRVLRGESVPASEKLFSIFEPHTDIIVKDNREPIYGHKICLSAGPSGLVTDVVIEQGNPADVTLAVKMMQRQRDLFGKAPRQAAFDGGFASRANLADIKKLGVRDVAFSKRVGLAITAMVRSTRVYRHLRNFRSGLEGIISRVKRGFGMRRADWRGLASFKASVLASVLAANFVTVARHLIAALG